MLHPSRSSRATSPIATPASATEKSTAVSSTDIFTLNPRYTGLTAIGKGSYGVVCSALDASTGRRVAIKKVTPVFRHAQDAKHTLREIRLLRHMGKHANIVSLLDLHLREDADELYIVMELMDADLHKLLQSEQPLTDQHLRYFLAQLLCGVHYLHSHRIIHRDLKPGNILVTRDCSLRITDFGLARERPLGRGDDPEEVDEPMTEHVVTRWYRPPELMLCPDGLYTYAVDMWSVGTIFAEMILRRPLFPGKNFVHQLTMIFDVIGGPSQEETSHIKNSQAKKFLESQYNKPTIPFMTCIPNLTQDASNLIEKLLVFNPAERLDAASALSIPYVSSAAPPQSLVFPPITEYFDFGFEKVSSRQALKHLVAEETVSFKRELALHQRRTTMQARVEAPTTVTPAAPSSSARKPVPNPAVEAQSDAVAIEVISTGSKQRSPSSREALVRKQLAAIALNPPAAKKTEVISASSAGKVVTSSRIHQGSRPVANTSSTKNAKDVGAGRKKITIPTSPKFSLLNKQRVAQPPGLPSREPFKVMRSMSAKATSTATTVTATNAVITNSAARIKVVSTGNKTDSNVIVKPRPKSGSAVPLANAISRLYCSK